MNLEHNTFVLFIFLKWLFVTSAVCAGIVLYATLF